jgi:hypothetical protein
MIALPCRAPLIFLYFLLGDSNGVQAQLDWVVAGKPALAMKGDTAGAKQAYHDFFAAWKDADPDLPQLVQAKAEFSALK